MSHDDIADDASAAECVALSACVGLIEHAAKHRGGHAHHSINLLVNVCRVVIRLNVQEEYYESFIETFANQLYSQLQEPEGTESHETAH